MLGVSDTRVSAPENALPTPESVVVPLSEALDPEQATNAPDAAVAMTASPIRPNFRDVRNLVGVRPRMLMLSSHRRRSAAKPNKTGRQI